MNGKLIIIEGSDASGKATQTKKLYNRLVKENFIVKMVEYPNYKSDSSALVKMYLKGDFGKDPSDIDPYIASTFYAVDRYASFITEWKEFHDNGGIIIADRYTTSNMVHQASKIINNDEKNKYLDWLWDLEFNMYKLPVPDCVIFLDMPPEYSKVLMKERLNKITGEELRDIHERNYDYLVHSYNNALFVANKYNWHKINCIENLIIRSVDLIHEDIYNKVKNELLDKNN